MNNRKLVLENGKVFEGVGFGYDGEVVAELVFNTAVVGYQEMLSDPTYYGQMVCMTYPIIGTYGMTDEDYESKNIVMSGLIVREYNDAPSNFRYTRTLSEVMVDNKVVGIEGVDTRELTRIIRDGGSQKAIICDIDKPLAECLAQIKEVNSLEDAVAKVSTKKVWYSRTANPKYNVVAIDCGVRLNLIKKLNQAGCNVVVVPYNTTVEEILKYKPNGLFISNGPGNPECAEQAIEVVKNLKGKMPILGIELGMCVIGVAYVSKLIKNKLGHHGVNNPVKNLSSNK
ncbi:MAG: glutamine-hydrolyzing carbamoyl-phosphate synthase small subunit, partial [Acholeplasmatales bacterium]|nr:glutamine-hydrolyzing carbamoyl-phosphate synthase small subunit [Acholeplasmatales bacterium]